MSTRTTAPNYQCQTNGHDLIGFNVSRVYKIKLSMPQTNGHDLIGFNVSRDTRSNYQCHKPMGTISQASMSAGTQDQTINAKPMGTIS